MNSKTKKAGAATELEKIKAMPQAKFDAAVEKMLADAAATMWAVQAMLDARRQTAP